MFTIGNNNKNPHGFLPYMAGTLGGLGAGYSSLLCGNFVSDTFSSNATFYELSNTKNPKKVYMDAFHKSGLDKKGAKVFFVPLAKGYNDFDMMEDIKNIISNIDDFPEEEKILNALYPDVKPTLYDKICDKLENLLRKKPENKALQKIADYLFGSDMDEGALLNLDSYISLKYDDNALFVPQSNSIFVPDTEVSTPFFHEMGHAINYNLKKGGKFLSNLACIKFDLALVLAAASLILPEDENRDKNHPINFLQNNAGKLTFLASMPVLLEEFFASLNGLKAAKPLLDKTDYKKFVNSYSKGFMGYLSNALAISLGTFFGVKLKKSIQKMVEKKLQKPLFAKEKGSTDSAQG